RRHPHDPAVRGGRGEPHADAGAMAQTATGDGGVVTKDRVPSEHGPSSLKASRPQRASEGTVGLHRGPGDVLLAWAAAHQVILVGGHDDLLVTVVAGQPQRGVAEERAGVL